MYNKYKSVKNTQFSCFMYNDGAFLTASGLCMNLREWDSNV